MPTLAWIVLAGSAMALLALSGSLTFVLPEQIFNRIVLPLVALAAGSLLGGALFHMLPESVAALGNELSVYVWLAAGLLTFLILEQYLHWHHCHRPVSEHRPVGYLILIADALHNLIGGLAIGAAFLTDIRLGIVTWLIAAAHEIPQEMGDFGILVHSGWSRRRALSWNLVSASTVLVGALAAYGLAEHVDIAVLIPFAAGNFIYIALADLVPELTTKPAAHDKAIHTVGFAAGLALLLGVALAVRPG
ncbi:ZIP family metal transporter [Solwaraspora sp. WMMB762]|uniref:ZIP family metal transporter n=1 Tax=Solwaraspora sp. WMMB762 TaxID=3404120 RepID=UPI003B93F812